MPEFESVCNRIATFTSDRNWDQFHSPENLAKSISIEAGELLECYQWTADADDTAVKEELADVMNYCIQLAQKKGWDICQILDEKIDKNEKKYPVDKAYGKATKYTDL